MNRYYFTLLLFALLSISQTRAQQTIIKYLSGTGNDNTVKWDFFCTKGMNSGTWTTIPVPSNWELQGFGDYNYGTDKKQHDEEGLYKYKFQADRSWNNKQIELVFEGVMTDAEVKINGQPAGPVHQGAFYRFQYNITHLIKPDANNLLEVRVRKMSADSSVNNAEREGDFWIFGGIYRPVYLKILPQSFIERVAIDARADGSFKMEVFAENLNPGDEITAQVTMKGKKIGSVFKSIVNDPSGTFNLLQHFNDPQLWNPESPKLYTIEVSLRRNNVVLHTFQQSFGFRTVEVRKADGIYVNGKKILMKGVDRHSFWPESGRTLNRKIHLMDIELMKDMNMNAVRMSHYPPDAGFLDLCDSIGLFVLDELTGWHQKYATAVGEKLVKEMVTRDVNHPSILFWDNGNEGGWNTALDDDFALYDPQQRTVLHPWNKFNDIDTKHYPDYTYVEKAVATTDILLHTEMIHGLYDGGHGAGLEDYWNLIRKNPHHAGGFLWVLTDEGVVRTDKKDSIDTDGNHAPDGIVGPHREKEASYYTIKEIWSPVQVTKPNPDKFFTGKLQIENNYIYTNLSACKFSWELIKYRLATDIKTGHSIITSGKAAMQLAPGQTGTLQLSLPADWHNADALQFTAIDNYGHELYRWTWPVKTASDIAQKFLSQVKYDVSIREVPTLKEVQGEVYSIIKDANRFDFDTATGFLKAVYRHDQLIPFGNGPSLAGVKQTLQTFKHYRRGDIVIVEAAYSGSAILNVKWIFTAGMPVKLEYTYTQTDSANFYGIVFNIDEAKITGMKWLGDGPFRVWKNRLKGGAVDVWHKKYNNTITGENYVYPEFKGYHSNMYWVTIQSQSSSFTVYTDKEGLFLQMMQPARPSTVFIPHVNPPFPQGNLGFLNAIAPIGTKFRAANTMGPQSQLNAPGPGKISGTLWFDFR